MISTIQLHIFSWGSVSSVIFDFNAFIFVIVSNGNLLVNRVGVSLIISLADAETADDADDADDETACLLLFFIVDPPTPDDDDDVDDDDDDDDADDDDDDDEKIHLLYIVNVGRLNGINLHR
jgi:hypothetical protein